MKNNVFWPVMLKNAVAIICFTALAVLFQHWWIALFSILLQHDVKNADNNEQCNGSITIHD